MPVCRYTLHVNDVNGPPADFAKVGDAVFHRWTCETGDGPCGVNIIHVFTDLYAIKVKNCFVDDGKSRRFMLIDSNGLVHANMSSIL
jgi:hypothetical protein